jgi:hypothetical protein
MKKLLLTIVNLIFSTLLFSQDGKLPIIDMHQHARAAMPLKDDGTPVPRLCFPSPCERKAARSENADDIQRINLEMMQRYKIVLVALNDVAALSDDLNTAYKWKSAMPDRFIIGRGLFHPSELDLNQFKNEIQSGKTQMIGEIATQYSGIPPNDPSIDTLYALAELFDVPVLIHCAGLGGGDSRFKLASGNPLLLESVLIKHPKLRLYVENAGWPYLEEMVSLMYRFPNVYADISTITWIIDRSAFNTFLQGLMNYGLGKRLMFGSDQMSWPEVIEDAIKAINTAPYLTIEQKRDIFYNNAARFLRLSKEQIEAHHRN